MVGRSSRIRFIKSTSIFYTILYMLCSAAYVEGASKHDFLQNRSSKGLLYYYNATGNADYDKGGDHYDVLRVLG